MTPPAMTPHEADARHRQGLLAAQAGRFEEAMDLIGQAIAAYPTVPAWWANYGLVMESLGDVAGAANAYAGALNLDPALDHAMDGLLAMAEAVRRAGDSARAEAFFRRAIALNPRTLAAVANLGVLLRAQGRREEAVALYRRAGLLDPGSWIHPYNLGNALAELNRFTEADAAYVAALEREPGRVEVRANRATRVLAMQGRAEEALAEIEAVLQTHPDVESLNSSRLYLMQFVPSLSMETVAQAHGMWGSRFRHAPIPAVAAPAPKIRIGYVSPDFRAHPVGFFLEPVLANHDRSAFEIVCYANTANPDWKTERLMPLADGWVWTPGMDDEALAARIQADGIHILVDLAGHTFGNRLPVFARRAAPVQVTWAGYVGSTGLPAMDYLISDSRQSPAGADGWATEAIVRMPDGYVPWAPPEDAPPVSPLPLANRGYATFGSFNALPKLNAWVAGLWAEVLKAVPDSRLLLRTPGFEDPGTAARVMALFERAGVDPARVDLMRGAPHRAFLAGYAGVDVALDPFPYSGGLTTLEALWMGVPVVTLGGDRFCSLHSVTHLASAGLSDLVASGPEDYVAKAAALVADPAGLAQLRASLRDRMAASPTLDGARFTRALEAAYGIMWQRFQAEQGRVGFTLNFQ
ncbi:O-linked N-acetylglucosamine transferase, SPINDLY family protein [Azospirillum rugosum]|uniref:protein O-GlcNAc transferase n=1 Tax=Azospirillum rugosum TaxID=416170 RepID=A0ABS4SHR8_9PROT|nr:glycosyltransferase family 41 protein [Azospirillum rugosum]MBP2292124.1 putative O-linked N-acetylglucosamine transferase (SPINDLY family) [Azospirillum rugosum]MDQ0525740.1 putative O-linked N-acetylglucosamine transferase (SPINDLY family) [Azospirillum rugosum]